MGVANEVVLINNTLNKGVSEAKAELAWREGERSAPVLRTYWRAKEKPKGCCVLPAPPAPEALYVENVTDLKRGTVEIDLEKRNGFQSGWELVPRHSRGALCVVLVLPPGKAADYGFRPHLGKVTGGRIAIYYKPKKPKDPTEAIPIAWTLREPHGSLEDEVERINHPRFWRRLLGQLHAIETEKLVVGANTAKNLAIVIVVLLIVSLVVIAIWQGTPALDLLKELLKNRDKLI